MKESKKLFITILLAAGLLTAVAATENAGRAVLGISPHEKEITVTAVTADGSPVQVEGCTVTEFPSGEETVLPKESGSAVPASAEFRAAFKAAKQKNWKLYMQTEDENGTEIRLQEE